MLWMRFRVVFVSLLSSIVLVCAGGRRSPVEPDVKHLGLGNAAASEEEYSAALPQGESGVELPKKLYNLAGRGQIAKRGRGTEDERMGQVVAHLRDIHRMGWRGCYHMIWGIRTAELGRIPTYDRDVAVRE